MIIQNVMNPLPYFYAGITPPRLCSALLWSLQKMQNDKTAPSPYVPGGRSRNSILPSVLWVGALVHHELHSS